MRARNLKPSLFTNEVLGEADPLLTLLFEGLWCLADREGRLEDLPLRICGQLFPYRRAITEKKCDQMLWWLHDNGFVQRYVTEDGQALMLVTSFLEHQNPHVREQASKLQALDSPGSRLRQKSEKASKQRKRKSTTKAVPSTGRGKAQHRTSPAESLFSDSPFLNPESSLRERAREGGGDGCMQATRTQARPAEPPEVPRTSFERWQEVKAAYPPGTYRQHKWALAQREAEMAVEAGLTTWGALLACANRYHDQQRARGKVGTDYVLSPENFFARSAKSWDEPFPPPRTGGAGPTTRAMSADELEAALAARGTPT